jgi:type III restriction enzyme
LALDPLQIPDEVRVIGLATELGSRLSLMGPGRADDVSLDAWRRTKRIQELEFELASALTKRYAKSPTCEVPAHALFPQMLGIVHQFLTEKVNPAGRTDRKDVFLDPYFSWTLHTLAEAIVPDEAGSQEIPRYEAHRGAGSTRDVDFWTSKPIREAQRSHLNYVVMDTERWEQSAAFYLDTDPHVIAFVKNFNLGFAIPYTYNNEVREYLPDFLVRLQKDGDEVGTLILETKGYDPLATAKEAGARRWVAAVNTEGSHGHWAYRLIKSPTDTPEAIRSAADELALTLRRAVMEAKARA